MTLGEKRFNRKLDKIRRLEEAGVLAKKKKRSRAFSKFMGNKLAVIGAVVFIIILLACIFAPLLTPYDPAAFDLMSIAKTARKHGKFAGTLGGIGNQDELIAMGYQFISLGADVVALSAYFKNIVDHCSGKDAMMP